MVVATALVAQTVALRRLPRAVRDIGAWEFSSERARTGRRRDWPCPAGCCYDHSVLKAPLAQLAEQRTLNPRVRGSSPWRRTRSDLGFYRSRSFFMRPVCPGFSGVLAPCLLGGRMLGPGRLVQFQLIGLDQSNQADSAPTTQRDSRRRRFRQRDHSRSAGGACQVYLPADLLGPCRVP